MERPSISSAGALTPGNAARYTAAALLTLAAAIHFAVMPEHFAEGLPFGTFMLTTAICQLAAAVLVVLRPSRLVTQAAILGNLVILAIFGIAYTVGLPVVGDGPEMLTVMGITATVAEALLVLVLAPFLWPVRHVARARVTP